MAKQVFENQLPPSIQKPTRESDRNTRQEWIKNKYIDKLFLAPVDTSQKSLEGVLHDAVKSGDTVATLNLIAHGAQVNYKDPNNNLYSALHIGILQGHVWLCDLLIQNGADINVTDTDGWTPLHHCAYTNNIHCIVLLIRRGVNISSKNTLSQVFFSFSLINFPIYLLNI